jgi:hypothetical protein
LTSCNFNQGYAVQSSGLKNSQPTPFIQSVKSGIPGLDQCIISFKEVVAFEPLAKTWHVTVCWCKAKSVEFENYCIAASRRARAGLNAEPGTANFHMNSIA